MDDHQLDCSAPIIRQILYIGSMNKIEVEFGLTWSDSNNLIQLMQEMTP